MSLPPFLLAHEERLWRQLVQARPDLEAERARLEHAPALGLSPVSQLVQERALSLAEVAAAAQALEPQRLAWGPFEVLREAGRGASGVVFEARQGERALALKVWLGPPDPARAQRFRREAALLERLAHPALAELVHAGIEADTPFLATTWLPGGDLAAAGRQPPARALAWLSRLAGGLGLAHSQGVVHRDLTPRNVVLDAAGEPVLVDFGLAKGAGAGSLTATGFALGSPSFAAPEQLGDARHVGPAADVFGLGALGYWLLSGRRPFPAEQLGALVRAIRRGPEPLAELDPAWREVCEPLLRWALDPDPRVRPSLAELSAALKRAPA